MKTLFDGKKKLITAPFIALLALFILPFAIGGSLAWLANKKIGNKIARYAIIAIIVFFTLPTGTAWIAGIASPSTISPQIQSQPEVKGIAEENPDNKPQNDTSQSVESAKSTPTPTPQPTPTNKNRVTAEVVRVVDGDTIVVDLGSEGVKTVRYIGIDTPETVDPRKPVQCFGKEASNKNSELLKGGFVELEKDVSEIDKYDRLLRYVYVGDLFINEELVKQGYAHSVSYPPDIKYQDLFRQAEKVARDNNLGLWSSCIATPIPIVTSKPTYKAPLIVPTQTTAPVSNTTSRSYPCDCKKTCTEISSCAEAQYLLKVCGCTARDNDKDGIACDAAPLHCQQ